MKIALNRARNGDFEERGDILRYLIARMIYESVEVNALRGRIEFVYRSFAWGKPRPRSWPWPPTYEGKIKRAKGTAQGRA